MIEIEEMSLKCIQEPPGSVCAPGIEAGETYKATEILVESTHKRFIKVKLKPGAGIRMIPKAKYRLYFSKIEEKQNGR